MSAKWVRSKRWDDEHLTGALLPVKVVLRVLSGIPLAVVLLSFVAFYGVLASVPIGLLALAPTYVVYGLTLVLVIAALALAPVRIATGAMRARGVGARVRFASALLGVIVLGLGAAWLWGRFVWPQVRYDAATGAGFRMFGSFVDRYGSVQFRRLPIMEMSELEFYGWWPLRVVLLLFVLNMVTATVRRIEFSFPYIGVLTVHTGIVLIALGSVYYHAHKQEGDMILLAGNPGPDGGLSPGPPERGFYDNTATALWVRQAGRSGWEQRRLDGVPRYNDYNLDALGIGVETPPGARDLGPLNEEVPEGLAADGSPNAAVDPDVRFRIVGYASYADLVERWVPASGGAGSGRGVALRSVEALLDTPAPPGGEAPAPAAQPRQTWRLIPDVPASRVQVLGSEQGDVLGIEYTRGMPAERREDLSSPLPFGAEHAIVVRVPASGFRAVYPIQPGVTIPVGETGYRLTVTQLAARPPFQIITKGYENAASSVAVVRVEPPGPGAAPFDRWVYHRFPEISQDLLAELNERGMPRRRDADPAISISYIDASIVQVYLDEPAEAAPGGTGGTPVRALVRLPGGQRATVTPDLRPGDAVQVAPAFRLRLGERIDNAVAVEAPAPVDPGARDGKLVGTHQRAALAVEASMGGWKSVRWLPFTQYLDVGGDGSTRVFELPDGRRVEAAFGRVWHAFWPEMGVRLVDFKMTPYPHSDVPQDYRSDVEVLERWGELHRDVRAKTSLNEPLLVRTPFVPRRDVAQPMRSVVNAVGRLFAVVAPNQYKFAQAGWDQSTWRETQAAAERGELARPFVRFTILGVGNNPGIYIIAAGAVMMSVGIPWAFYVKPLIMRRRKRKIQESLRQSPGRQPGPAARPADLAERVGT